MKRDQFGPYRLLRLLSRDRMGDVYEADNTITQCRVAVKIFSERLSQDPAFAMRTQRETTIAVRALEPHLEPHLVPIHDVGEIDGRVYVDTALIDGMDLKAILARDGPLSPARAAAIVDQIASALDTMHAAGLLNRVVAPAKILVNHEDFAYLLLQFATVTSNEDDLSGPGFLERLAYCAPEVLTTGDIGAGADIYALTCVLYECLTGCRPYGADSIERQAIGHLTEDPPKPTDVNPALPAGFDEVIARGMAKQSENRYPSAGDLARAARDALA